MNWFVFLILLAWSESVICSVVSDSLPRMDYNSAGSMEFSRQEYAVGSHSLLQELFLTPGILFRYPDLQADSLPSEPPGKPWLA